MGKFRPEKQDRNDGDDALWGRLHSLLARPLQQAARIPEVLPLTRVLRKFACGPGGYGSFRTGRRLPVNGERAGQGDLPMSPPWSTAAGWIISSVGNARPLAIPVYCTATARSAVVDMKPHSTKALCPHASAR